MSFQTTDQTTQPNSPHDPLFTDEEQLLRDINTYLRTEDIAHVERVVRFLHEIRTTHRQISAENTATTAPAGGTDTVAPTNAFAAYWKLDDALSHAVSIAQTLAEALHIDAVTLAAVLVYPMIESNVVQGDVARARLGGAFGDQVAHTIESLQRFDTTQRPGSTLRRNAVTEADGEEADRERRRKVERRRQQDADAQRKMFLAMAEDPRVVIIKIADQLRLMRAIHDVADTWRARAGQPTSREIAGAEPTPTDTPYAPPWTLDECRQLAEETREVYAPLAARLGMGRVEGELEDLAFAVLEPGEYRWLSEAVEEQEKERRSYVERVCAALRTEMRAIGIDAEVSGRVKHLYSIYKKVQRSENRDLSDLFDILAFRIIVDTVAACYQALGHVHELWHPKDGRIKDFIAGPKPNGYQSLHTTVFCLDGRLAEIQIRTREMHALAEYGVAMHWYYKDVGDNASAKAKPLQAWIQQVKEWQQELQSPGGSVTPGVQRALDAVKGDVLKEQIFIFTPAGDVKELPAGSTPLDFAYRIHSNLGDHVAGARVTTADAGGRLVKRMVPLDYELKGGDVVEIVRRADAHPTRDWLRFARTKAARTHILRYLKAHERDIDLQIGRERLDRDLRAIGVRKGFETLTDDDLKWIAEAVGQPDAETLLVSVGRDSVRISTVMAKIRERLKLQAPAEQPVTDPSLIAVPTRESDAKASVAGLGGMMTRPANCCNPLPGDPLMGFITRGRGVVIHRADCPNIRTLLAREPERIVAVEWPKAEGAQALRAHIIVEGMDRTGLLRDVTLVISTHKLNMVKVETITKSRPGAAVINAILEIQRPEDLEPVLADLRAVEGVALAERKEPSARKTPREAKRPRK